MINYVYCGMEYIFVSFIFKKLSEEKIKYNIIDLIAFLIISITIGSIPTSHPALSTLLNHFLYLAYIFISRRKEKNKTNFIILFGLTFGIIAVLQIIIVISLNILNVNMFSKYFGFIGNSITILMSVLIMKIPIVRSLYIIILKSSLYLKILFVNSYFLMYTFIVVGKAGISMSSYNMSILGIIIALLLFFDMTFVHYEQRIKFKEKELSTYQKNFEIYKSLLYDIRSSQHEYYNRIQSLMHLADTCNTYEELSGAIRKYTKNYSTPNNIYPLLKINMPLFAASLYNLYLHASSNDINIRFSVSQQELSSKIPEVLLADLSCILLQNAIEASSSGDTIHVFIRQRNTDLTVEVRNQVDDYLSPETISSFFSKKKSSKPSVKEDGIPHGLGLYYLHNEILKNHCQVFADCIPFDDKFWLSFQIVV